MISSETALVLFKGNMELVVSNKVNENYSMKEQQTMMAKITQEIIEDVVKHVLIKTHFNNEQIEQSTKQLTRKEQQFKEKMDEIIKESMQKYNEGKQQEFFKGL